MLFLSLVVLVERKERSGAFWDLRQSGSLQVKDISNADRASRSADQSICDGDPWHCEITFFKEGYILLDRFNEDEFQSNHFESKCWWTPVLLRVLFFLIAPFIIFSPSQYCEWVRRESRDRVNFEKACFSSFFKRVCAFWYTDFVSISITFGLVPSFLPIW